MENMRFIHKLQYLVVLIGHGLLMGQYLYGYKEMIFWR